MGSVQSLVRLAAGQGLQDRLARLRHRQEIVENLIRTLEAYDRERQPAIEGSSAPGYRLRANMPVSA